MSNSTIIPQELAYQKFHDAMQLFVGQGRRWSCAAISQATGIALRTVESYRSGQATPSIEKYQSLCAVMGQGFFAATIEHLAYEVRAKQSLDIAAPKLLSEVLSFGSELAQALEDGRIDHQELAQLKRSLGDLHELISGVNLNTQNCTPIQSKQKGRI